MQTLGRVRQQVPVLVDCAALHRHAVPDGRDGLVEPRRTVDDEELGPTQPALDEVVEHGAPGIDALAAHAPDGEQDLLAIRAYAEDDQQRDRGRLAVGPHANNGAVEDQSHNRLPGQRAAVPAVPVALHLAYVRLTVSLPTVPPNKAAGARRAPQSRSDRTSCRKVGKPSLLQAAKNLASWWC